MAIQFKRAVAAVLLLCVFAPAVLAFSGTYCGTITGTQSGQSYSSSLTLTLTNASTFTGVESGTFGGSAEGSTSVGTYTFTNTSTGGTFTWSTTSSTGTGIEAQQVFFGSNSYSGGTYVAATNVLSLSWSSLGQQVAAMTACSGKSSAMGVAGAWAVATVAAVVALMA